MGKVAYSAIDQYGNKVDGFVEAESNLDAVIKLQEVPLYSIQLHGDVSFSKMRTDWEGLDEAELNRFARFERENQTNPGVLTSFKYLLEYNKKLFMITLAMIVVGLYSDISWLWIVGLLIDFAVIGFWIYGYRDAKAFDEIYRLKTFGEFENAIKIILVLRERLHDKKNIVFQLDKLQAEILSCQGRLNEALTLIKQHQMHIGEILPDGMYENAVASLYGAAGDYDKLLETMQALYSENSQSLFALDLAFSEARFGEISQAKELLKKVKPIEIPVYGAGMYDWILGIVAHKEGRLDDAKAYYDTMMQKFEPYIHNPIMWEGIALATGTYADLLYDVGQSKDGERLLLPGTVKILNVHMDSVLRQRLSEKYPEYITKQSYCKSKTIK